MAAGTWQIFVKWMKKLTLGTKLSHKRPLKQMAADKALGKTASITLRQKVLQIAKISILRWVHFVLKIPNKTKQLPGFGFWPQRLRAAWPWQGACPSPDRIPRAASSRRHCISSCSRSTCPVSSSCVPTAQGPWVVLVWAGLSQACLMNLDIRRAASWSRI